MGLKDKIVRALALRWLRGQVEGLRGKKKETGMGKVFKALDGWKLVIGVVIMFGCGVWDSYHNGHTGQFVGAILNVLGWAPSGDWSGETMLKAVGGAVAVIGFVHKLVKAQQQARAGAPKASLLSIDGYVQQYIHENFKAAAKESAKSNPPATA